MKTLKVKLPDGVRKKFIIKVGKKVRLLNRDNFKPKKAK